MADSADSKLSATSKNKMLTQHRLQSATTTGHEILNRFTTDCEVGLIDVSDSDMASSIHQLVSAKYSRKVSGCLLPHKISVIYLLAATAVNQANRADDVKSH